MTTRQDLIRRALADAGATRTAGTSSEPALLEGV